MSRKGKILIGVGFVAVLIVAILIVGALRLYSFLSEPLFADQEHQPDAVLIQNFQRHRGEFEELRTMLERDSHIHRIDDNWSDPTNLSDEILAKYREMFAKLGIPRGFYNRRNPLRIELIASSRGWATSGSMKGYEYRETKPESLEDSLDKFHDGTVPHWTQAHRHIEGKWYLYFER